MSRRERAWWIAVLALWALGACFVGLGAAPVVLTNEAREGVYVRAMLDSGNFLAPVVPNHVENGELVPDKPPLFHWLAAGATIARSWLAGNGAAPGPLLARAVDEWAVRFPSALSAFVLVIAVALGGAAFVGERAALFAAAALLTGTQFGYQARFGRVDMTLTCFAALATLLAGRALLDERRAIRLPIAGAAAGLAVLAKGPLGAVLPALACVAFLVTPAGSAYRAAARRLPWRTTIAVLFAVALPWYVAAGVASAGAVVRSQLIAENFVQFSGVDGRMRELFYLRPWLLDSLPWNLIAVAAVIDAWRRREPGPAFCAAWWLSSLLFFQVAAYKRRAYLLPTLPAEALLAGWFVDARLLAGRFAPTTSDWTGLSRRLVPFGIACAVLAALGALIAPILAHAWVGDAIVTPLDGGLAVGGAAAVALSVGVLVRALQAGERRRALIATWAGLGIFHAVVVSAGLVVVARMRSAKPLVARIERELPEPPSLTVCGIDPDQSLGVLFYFRDLRRVAVLSDGASCPRQLPAGFYLVPQDEWNRISRSRDGGAELWSERLRGELRGWRDRTAVVLAERSSDRAGRTDRLAEQ